MVVAVSFFFFFWGGGCEIPGVYNVLSIQIVLFIHYLIVFYVFSVKLLAASLSLCIYSIMFVV